MTTTPDGSAPPPPAASPSPRELAEALEAVARVAGAELRRRFGGLRTVEKKGVIDLVTDADRAAEALILEALDRAFPGATVLAEESGARAGTGPGAGLRFIVDPLDGTTNYAAGIPHFCTTLAVEDGAGLAAGVVYEPLRDELYLAARGGGATLDGRPLRISRVETLDDAVLATGFPYDVREQAPRLLGYFEAFVVQARAIRRFGSAALDLAWVAQGRFDGYWERGVKPWDIAAGMLLVTEAGGEVSDYEGRPARVDGGEVVAAPAALRARMVALTRRAG
jgi:myo-inositol-1(or 4)-monophosphatase